MGKKMRSENQLAGIERQLLEDLARMTVSEDGVGGKIVGHGHEMCARRGFLAGSGYAGLGIGNDAAIAIHNAGREQGRQRQNDGSRIAAGIRDQSGGGYLFRMQFGQTVHGALGEFRRSLGVGVCKAIDGTMLVLFQPPRAAQIDDPQPASQIASGTISREKECGVARNNSSTPCCSKADQENGWTGAWPLPLYCR